jgi:NAD(P)H-flavin reductase
MTDPLPRAPAIPEPMRILERIDECRDVVTLLVHPVDGELPFARPAQFSMIGRPGIGEVPISISSDLDDRRAHGYTIRRAGAVTGSLVDCDVGDVVIVRGPFGSPWDLDAARGRDVVFVAGGIGIAPLRSAIHTVVRERNRYARVSVLVGSLEPDVILYRSWLESLAHHDVHVSLTVDHHPPGAWNGHVGLVTALISDVVRTPDLVAFVCGPDAMMRATIDTFQKQDVATSDVQVTLERNMHCGCGWCGHCQLGDLLVCRDGPVVTARRLGRQLVVEAL